MNDLGIHTGLDLKQWSQLDLIKHFGKTGGFYYDIVRGIDNRPVKPNRERKSIAVERTMQEDMTTLSALEERLKLIADKLVERLDNKEKYGRTITLKLKTADFDIITRSRSVSHPVIRLDEILSIGLGLLRDNYSEPTPIRLIGLTSSNFVDEDGGDRTSQLSLDF